MSKRHSAVSWRAMGVATIVFLAAVTPLRAQPSTSADARWTPWLGCWELVDEDVIAARLAGLEAIDAARDRASSTPAQEVRVCVAAATQAAGVTLTTTVGNQRALEETIVADATERPFSEADCRGSQRAEWSTTGQRLFSRAELTCAGQAPRRVSGFALMEPGNTWLDIQVVEIAGRTSTRSRRYHRIADSTGAVSDAIPTRIFATPLTLQDVVEASAKLPARAVEAALIETNARFDLNGQRLIELDDAGVADEITDLMVALSFRDKFVVDRASRGGTGYSGGMWNDPYSAAYYYAPFAYSSFGYYDPYYYYGPGYVVIDPGNPGSPGEPQPSGTGRVVDGQGYTRVRPRETSPTNGGGRLTGSSGDSSGGSSSGASGGSSGVSSGGYSGGSSGDSGRTAQPRPPK